MSVKTTARLTVWLAAVLLAASAWASVALTARVVRGGFDLDFGTVTPGEASRTEELELTLASTGGGQYRVYQELPGLLVNERGERLPERVLRMQIARGLSGRPRTGGIIAVSDSLQELFVSDAAGTSDTLLLAYSILPEGPRPASGSYRGVLRFTVESLSTGAVVTQTINVRAEVTASFGLDRDPASPSWLSYSEVEPGARTPAQELALRLTNNTASPTEVTHELVEPLANARGDRLPAEAVRAAVLSSVGGREERPMSGQPEPVVTDPRGEVSSLRVAYAVAVPDAQPAGSYRGTLRLRLTGMGTIPPAELLVPIEVSVKEIFTLSVRSLEDAGHTLRFSRTGTGSEAQEQHMLVDIRTNMGRPYQVLFGLDHPLVLETGDTLPADALAVSVEHTGAGQIVHAAGSPVSVGYQPLYQSDGSGSPGSFVVQYRLGIPRDAKAGEYKARLRFSITTF
jgi:hypothetical protein